MSPWDWLGLAEGVQPGNSYQLNLPPYRALFYRFLEAVHRGPVEKGLSGIIIIDATYAVRCASWC